MTIPLNHISVNMQIEPNRIFKLRQKNVKFNEVVIAQLKSKKAIFHKN